MSSWRMRTELEGLMKIFEELLDDVDIETKE